MSEIVATFPGGRLVTVTIAGTAGNVVTNKTPGVGKRWVILYGIITLVTDATVVNRYMNITLTDGTNVLVSLGSGSARTATQTSYYNFGPARYAGSNMPGEVSNSTNSGMDPNNMIIEGADQFRITITGGVAGDSYSGFMRVMELSL